MDKEPKFPLYLVVWKDAQSDSQWSELDKVKIWGEADCVIWDIGWVIHESKSHIIICSQICEEGDVGSRTKIPTDWIIKKQKIRFKYNPK